MSHKHLESQIQSLVIDYISKFLGRTNEEIKLDMSFKDLNCDNKLPELLRYFDQQSRRPYILPEAKISMDPMLKEYYHFSMTPLKVEKVADLVKYTKGFEQ